MPESYHDYTEREAKEAGREERMEREDRFLPEEFLLFRPVIQPLEENEDD